MADITFIGGGSSENVLSLDRQGRWRPPGRNARARAAYRIDQHERVVGLAVAPPGDVPVRSHQHQSAPVQGRGLAVVDPVHRERDAAARGGAFDGVVGTSPNFNSTLTNRLRILTPLCFGRSPKMRHDLL
jgi:hypothetical protein